jgi:hypothetical protein
MSAESDTFAAVELPADLLDLVVDEAERAVLWVDARIDEPGARYLDGLPADDALAPNGVAELRLAAAELIDAHPGIQHELERIGDRVRSLGPRAALQLLDEQPAVLDLARLSLETFFRLYPDAEVYEQEMDARELDLEELGRGARDTYRALLDLRGSLRSRLS